ncbi:MAG: stage III sporulation AC/AD family protein [Ruminococcus sp.]|nr:stage III sporulation AC/AD family protein [Ruminococcus sp.]
MIDRCIATAAFCLCSAILAVLLRQHCREQSMLLAIAVCSGVMVGFMGFAAPIMTDIRDIFADAGVSDSYMTLIFKATAISLITHITCELCADSGESAIASAAELWGRGAVIFISIPLIKSFVEQISVFLKL